jgi:hypothetical protein
MFFCQTTDVMRPEQRMHWLFHMVVSWLACKEIGMRSCNPVGSFPIQLLRKGIFVICASNFIKLCMLCAVLFLQCTIPLYNFIPYPLSGIFCCRILRDRALYKVTSDFVDAAVKGAIGVINRCIPPINPTDPECFHMLVGPLKILNFYSILMRSQCYFSLVEHCMI